MNPYYQDDRVTLYHGDCLETYDFDALETAGKHWRTADVLVTDPPYGISWRQGANMNESRNSRPHAGIVNDSDTSVRDSALRVWGLNRPSIVFGSFRSAPPTDVRQTLVWKKPIDAGVVGSVLGYRTDVELIYLRGQHQARPAARSSVLESRCGTRRYNPVNGGEGHPHAKPSAILEQLIEWTVGVVTDPFAGSGSTLIAARNLGRDAIGVEIEERYCELIARRLDQQCFDFEEPA